MLRTQKYGARIRKLVNSAVRAKNTRYECPKCYKIQVARTRYAVWECRSCGNTFAGGAYTLHTEPGEIANRMIHGYNG